MNRAIPNRLAAGSFLGLTSWRQIFYTSSETLPRWRLYSSQATGGGKAGSSDGGLSGMHQLSSMFGSASSRTRRSAGGAQIDGGVLDTPLDPTGKDTAEDVGSAADLQSEPYHFHIYSHRHNTHVTVTKPNRDPIISLSTGNLGFKKMHRKSYDAAYQLGAVVIERLLQGGWRDKIEQSKLEVVLRGFGAGREAVPKVLLGNEGRLLRPHIVRVADSTRLKFGGTRSPKPRRV